GHGYALRRPVWALIIIWLTGGLIFMVAWDTGRMRPVQPLVALNPEHMERLKTPGSPYEDFRPWLYSLDVLTPGSVLYQEEFWIPRDADEAPGGGVDLRAAYPALNALPEWALRALPFLEDALRAGGAKIWFWFEVIAGWVLTSIVIVGFTGLLRGERESER
ncbi:MAG: hypothetical protein ACLFV8_11765, partial [Alphaproteobacteria bacterium]